MMGGTINLDDVNNCDSQTLHPPHTAVVNSVGYSQPVKKRSF